MIVIVVTMHRGREARRYCEAERCQAELERITARFYDDLKQAPRG